MTVDKAVRTLRNWLRGREIAPISALRTFMDAHLIYGEKGLSGEALMPLFKVWWPELSLSETLMDLGNLGLLEIIQGSGYAVPHGVQKELRRELESDLMECVFRIPKGSMTFQALLNDFERYSETEMKVALHSESVPEVWGGRAYVSSKRRHHLLLRPFPLRFRPHGNAFVMMICQLPETGMTPITDAFVRSRPLRERLALLDMGQAHKINLTRSEVFVYFERYMRRVHGLRIGPAPALTRGLEDGGILSLQMG